MALACLTILSSACNASKKTVATPTPDIDPNSAEGHLQAIVRHQVQADWLDGTAKLSFDDGSFSVSGSATIKMQKDRAIWISVKKFGFEAGRAMVTPDSIFVINRMNNEYAAEPLSYIEKQFNLPADFKMLQQILLGNPVFMSTAQPKAAVEGTTLRWAASGGDAENQYWFAMPDYQLDRMEVKQPQRNRTLAIQLTNYKDAGANRLFSYLRKIAVESSETGKANVEIEFTKVEINVPTNISFSIPPGFKRMGK